MYGKERRGDVLAAGFSDAHVESAPKAELPVIDGQHLAAELSGNVKRVVLRTVVDHYDLDAIIVLEAYRRKTPPDPLFLVLAADDY